MYEANAGGKETPGLEDYLNAVRSRKWLVLACTLIGLGLALLYIESRTPTYSAEAKVIVNPTPVGAIDARLKEPNLEEEREKFDSFPVADQVIAELGLDADSQGLLLDSLSVSFRPDSAVLTAKYESTDTAEAQQLVNAFARQYVDARNAQDDAWYQGQLTPLQAELEPIDEELQIVEFQIVTQTAELDAVRATTNAANPDRTQEITNLTNSLASLRADRSRLSALRTPINASISQIQRDQATRAPAGEILQEAREPTTPVGLGDSTIMAIGLLGGLIVGVIASFVLDRLDSSARDEGDIELAAGTSVLGTVPRFGLGSRSGASAVVMLSSGKSANLQRSREAFRRLRTSVQYLSASGGLRSVIITSAQPGEGKSVMAANLAVALAQGGTSVVLVSADLRRPTVEELFSVPNRSGLSEALQSDNPSDVPLISVGVENLAIVPAGPTPERPGELLGSPQFQTLITRLEGLYDLVIIDTPPVLAAADAGAASAAADGVIVLVDTARTDTQLMLRVRSDLDRAGANVVGAVINRDRSRPGLFRSRYDYSYEKAAARSTA
ncbi:MAG: polysaccharide biosynthesis tyrosine autokinase [Acidimicrobiia bacterium]|nr:polysaccharide biosynthesis tyrosine autokinase [Acidimicrobiia bacterium]